MNQRHEGIASGVLLLNGRVQRLDRKLLKISAHCICPSNSEKEGSASRYSARIPFVAITNYSYFSISKVLHFCSGHGSNSIDKLYSLRFWLKNYSWFRHSAYAHGYEKSAKFKTLALATLNGDSEKRDYIFEH